MDTIKTTAKIIVFICSLLSAMVPFIVWATTTVGTFELFKDTWIWLFYAFIIYIMGFMFIRGLFETID